MLRPRALLLTSLFCAGCVPGVLSDGNASSSTARDDARIVGAREQTPSTPGADGAPDPSETPDAGATTPPPPDQPSTPPPAADAAAAPPPDTAPAALPATCDDGDPIDLTDARRPLRSDMVILERHFANGSPVESEIHAEFDDYTLYQGTPAPAETFGVNCVGLTGPAMMPGAKHCEYTTAACSSDADCGGAVACRETDRLDASSISVRGLAVGALNVDKLGIGRFLTTGLDAVFGSEDVNITLGKGEEHSHYAWDFYWFFSGVLAPKVVNVRTPDLSGATTIKTGEDLVFMWAPGTYYPQYESDLIYIELRVSAAEDARRVRCVVKDDGCKTIPAAALQWLTSASSPQQLVVAVSHHFPLKQKDYDSADIDWRLTSIREVRGALKVAP